MWNAWKKMVKFSSLVLATAAATWFVGASLNWAQEDATVRETSLAKAETEEDDRELLKTFVDALDQIEQNYVQRISRRELVEAAIQGMLSKLDQHTNYISPREIDHFKTGVESEFGGIGIHVKMQNGELTVLGPVAGSPAHRAGLVPGDVITQVEDKPIKGLLIDEATKLLKGKSGSNIEFIVRRKDGKSETMKLEREVVRMDTVLGWQRQADNTWSVWYDLEQKLAYVRISSFSRHTADDLRQRLDELSKAGMRGLLLDLRFNPGGLLSSAIEVSDMFVAEGRIVSTSGRNVEEKRWEAHRRGTFEGFPIAVLVNRASASASEIVAACLQDHGRAVVVGERTWGKGSVQNVVELERGLSALKLTTAKYFRPSGKDINRDDDEGEDGEWGVKPDPGYEVKSSVADLHDLATWFRIREQLHQGELTEVTSSFVDQPLDRAAQYLTESSGESKAAKEKKLVPPEKATEKKPEAGSTRQLDR